jgi:hypothetical protein
VHRSAGVDTIPGGGRRISSDRTDRLRWRVVVRLTSAIVAEPTPGERESRGPRQEAVRATPGGTRTGGNHPPERALAHLRMS